MEKIEYLILEDTTAAGLTTKINDQVALSWQVSGVMVITIDSADVYTYSILMFTLNTE